MATQLRTLRSFFSSTDRISGRPLVLALALCLALFGVGTGVASAQNTYVVDSKADNPDATPGDGTCQTSNNECTFRAALQEAGESTAVDTVSFANVPVGGIVGGDFAIIGLTGEQPTVKDAYVDGTTAPDYPSDMGGPIVGLDASGLDGGDPGLQQGIELDDGSQHVLRAVSVFSAPDDGIGVFEGNAEIIDCWVGVEPNGNVSPNGQNPSDNDLAAMYLGRDDTGVRGNLVSGHSCENAAPGANCAAIFADGLNISLKGNMVGVAPDGSADPAYANDGTGIWVEDVDEGQVDVGYGYDEAISGNPLPMDGGDGNIVTQSDSVGVVLNDTTQTAVRGNSIFGNDVGGIQTSDSYTGNDDGDTDEGINRGQNYPVVESTSCSVSGSETVVDVAYRVRSNADSINASNYGENGLKVDFYATDNGEAQGRTYLGTDQYAASDAGSSVTTTLTTTEAACSDQFVGTATSANNNTSQFSPSSALPVELASFEGTQAGERTVKLTWTTGLEQNNAGFRVQQATETGWTTLSFVEGKGTTTEGQTYQFTAEDLEPGTHRFRLTQVDLDGTTTVHDPVTVNLQMQEALRLSAPSPNPVQGSATFTFAVRDRQPTSVAVYNVLGQRVTTLFEGTPAPGESTSVRLETDRLSSLASGTYFLRLQTGEHTATERFTIVR